jgi:diguanylate cyclase (GGDEF)-like protein
MEVLPQLYVISLGILLCVAVAAVLFLAVTLRLTRGRLAQQYAILNRIESLAKMGHWHYESGRGTQYWSPQMRRIYGIEDNVEVAESTGHQLDRNGGDFLWQTLRDHAEAREVFRIEYDIIGPGGAERLLRMDALNAFDGNGNLRYVDAVISDVTDEYSYTRQLEAEKTEAVELAAEARALAMTDPLTGLANRRKAMAEIDKCILQCRQEGRNLSLIVFDLDDFKSINDGFGHQAGDKVLKRIAGIVMSQIRDSDLVGRVGGEEFIWLLPDACCEIAGNAAERLCRAIEASSGSSGVPPVTASAGYAVWQPGDTSLTLFAAAYAALYRAKEAGRNQVRMAA